MAGVPLPFLDYLGIVARQARLDGGGTLLSIAQTADYSEGALSRFERGEGSQWDYTRIIQAYEKELRLPRHELWRRALRLAGEQEGAR